MSDRAIPLQQVLAWSNGLMAARSLDQLAARLAQPPAADGESLTGVLLLLDPRHELRRLAAGGGKPPDPWPGLRFVDNGGTETEAGLRAKLNKARARGLLTAAPPGRAGGELTDKGRALARLAGEEG